MKTAEISEMQKEYLIPTYAPGIAFIEGSGTSLWDAEGREYLDFVSGIAVTNLGHCHPKMVMAVQDQVETLVHVSNLYYNEKQPQLAKALAEHSGVPGAKCFFCNSGAEANEGLIKLSRLWGSEKGKYEIITMRQSFHGRTLATLTAMVAHGFGVSIVPNICVPDPVFASLRKVPLGTAKHVRVMGVLTRTDCSKMRLVEALLNEIKATIESAVAGSEL